MGGELDPLRLNAPDPFLVIHIRCILVLIQLAGKREDFSSLRRVHRGRRDDPVDEALRIVLSVAKRPDPVTVPLHNALRLVLAEDVRAPDPLPPYWASIKDGYAVVASDGPGEYPVVTESRAGDDGVGVIITPGSVAYVTSGGSVPDGAEAAVQVEDTEEVSDTLNGLKRVRILTKSN